MLHPVRICKVGIAILLFAESTAFAYKGYEGIGIALRGVVDVRLQEPIHGLIRIERHEVAVARADVQLEPVRVPHKADKFVRYLYRLNVDDLHIRLSVLCRKTVLLGNLVDDFGYPVAVLCLLVNILVERAKNGAYRIVPLGRKTDSQPLDGVFIEHIIGVDKFKLIVLVAQIIAYAEGYVYGRCLNVFALSARLIDIDKQLTILAFGKSDYL